MRWAGKVRADLRASAKSGRRSACAVGRLRGRAAHASETKGAVVGHHHGAGFLAELHDRFIAQREARPIEYIEILEDQQSDRLAEIEYAYAPERLVTDDLRSYGAAARDLAPRASIETRR